MNSKRLHRHALPVVSFAIAGLLVSAAGAASLATWGGPNRDILANGLSTHPLSIQVSANGLATIKTAQPSSDSHFTGTSDLVNSALLYIALQPGN